MLSKIHEKYWAVLALLFWGGLILYFNIVSFEPYGIDEGAALALLINWAVSDNIVNPIVAFGMPDFRAMLFLPLGVYWTGSIFAAKVFTVIIAFLAGMFLFMWSRKNHDDEVALIATGLFLITPLVILQIDQMAVGIYLLFMIGLGCKVHDKQRTAERSIGNWYFIQMLLTAIIVSLHPIGLAYAAALALRWHQDPIDHKRKQHNFIGISLTVFIVLIMGAGWIDIHWFINPLISISTAVSGMDISGNNPPNILLGLAPALLLGLLILYDWRNLKQSAMGMTLLLAVVFGLIIADQTWAMMAMTILLYRGIWHLIKINNAIKLHNFLGQRGLVMALLLVLSTIFMNVDKSHAIQNLKQIKSPVDSLISTLALETEEADKHTRIASQWPARTMLAVRHAVLPLPPKAENGEAFMSMIKGITHIMFAHNDPANSDLARTIAEVTHRTKTLTIEQGGVIVLVPEALKPELEVTKTPQDQDTNKTEPPKEIASDK